VGGDLAGAVVGRVRDGDVVVGGRGHVDVLDTDPGPGDHLQVVERVGRFLPALLDWPHDVRTFTEALATVDDWYRTVHRDHAAVVAPSTGSASVELRLATPYPTAFEDGLVRGLVLEFVTDGTSVWTTSTTDSEGVTTYRFKLRTAID